MCIMWKIPAKQKTQKRHVKIEPLKVFTLFYPHPVTMEHWWDADKVTFEKAAAAIYAEFPPEGYGTDVQLYKSPFGDIVPVGSKRVLVTRTTRAASCD